MTRKGNCYDSLKLPLFIRIIASTALLFAPGVSFILASKADTISPHDLYWIITPASQLNIGPKAKCWTAESTTAIAITGDICLSDHRIVFGNGAYLSITSVTNFSSFPLDSAPPRGAPAEIFKVDHPQGMKPFLGMNTFPAKWLVVFPGHVVQPGLTRGLILYEYDSKKMPTPEHNRLSGSFYYGPK